MVSGLSKAHLEGLAADALPVCFPHGGTELEVLGVLLTSKCNFTCRHCCNESEPANSETVRFEEVARLIDEAREIRSIREVDTYAG
jgi:MoaA/NifB/PqqE/SkfB family radical SAM enzyme